MIGWWVRWLLNKSNTLLGKINNIDELKHEFNLSTYDEIFYFLDEKLYGDAKKTIAQINEEITLYHKFNFLTNSCEPFDGTKSFIFIDKNDTVNILYKIDYKENKIIHNIVERKIFEDITKEFIKWHEEENKNS